MIRSENQTKQPQKNTGVILNFVQDCIIYLDVQLLQKIDAGVKNTTNTSTPKTAEKELDRAFDQEEDTSSESALLAQEEEKSVSSGEEFSYEDVTKMVDAAQEFLLKKTDELKKNKKYADSAFINILSYGVVAFFDELLLTKNWSGADYWRAQLLEKRFFGTRAAGDIFFENCTKILENREPKYRELALAYYCFISSGFKGKYFYADDDHTLPGIKESLLNFYQEYFSEPTDEGAEFDFSEMLLPTNKFVNAQAIKIASLDKQYTWIQYVFFMALFLYVFGSLFLWIFNKIAIASM